MAKHPRRAAPAPRRLLEPQAVGCRPQERRPVMADDEPFDAAAAFGASVDRSIRLADELRFPDEWRKQVLTLVMVRSEAIRVLETREQLEAVQQLLEHGYAWARASQFTFVSAPESIPDLVGSMGASPSSWATVTNICWGLPSIFGEDDLVDDRDLDEVALEQIALTGRSPTQAMADAFTLGATMCGAEKRMVVAMDWNERKARVARMQRWDWLPWRRRR